MKTSRKSIEQFFSTRKIAIAGVSRNPKKFGNVIMTELRQHGFDIYPINPNAEAFGADPSFKSVEALPDDVKNLLVATPKSQTMAVVLSAINKGITNIWIQQGSDTPEVLEYLKDKELNLVTKQCVLMWTEPVKSIHRFHRWIIEFFGLAPK